MPLIHTNHQGHIAIELRRTGRSLKVVVILGHDGKLRRVRKFSPAQFDKDYQPIASDPKQVAFRWLESHNNNQRLLSDGALKEIIMLLIIKDNAVHAKFADNQATECQAAVDAIEGSCELIKSVEDLTEYSGKDLAELYNSLSPLKMGDRAKDKAKVAQKVWELAKALVTEKPASVVKTASTEKKVGIKQQIREKLVAGGEFTVDELLVEFGEDKKSTVVTALSDLRSEKYAGEGGALNIVKDKEKHYHLEVASA